MTTEPTDDITEEETALPQSDSAGETDTPDSDSAEHSDDESPNAEAARYRTRCGKPRPRSPRSPRPSPPCSANWSRDSAWPRRCSGKWRALTAKRYW